MTTSYQGRFGSPERAAESLEGEADNDVRESDLVGASGRSAAGLHRGAASGPSDSRRGLGNPSPRRRPCVLEK